MLVVYKQGLNVGTSFCGSGRESLLSHHTAETSIAFTFEEISESFPIDRSPEDVIETEMPKWPDCDVELLLLSIHECPQGARHRMTPDFLAMALSGLRTEALDSVLRELMMLHVLTYSRIYDSLIDSVFWRDLMALLGNREEIVRNSALQVADNLFFCRATETLHDDLQLMITAHASNLEFSSDVSCNDRVRCIEFYRGIAERYGVELLAELLNEEMLEDLIKFVENVDDPALAE
jgi:hypothetical protein